MLVHEDAQQLLDVLQLRTISSLPVVKVIPIPYEDSTGEDSLEI